MQIAGLIFDDSKHYLDHLAPFCAMGKWPLIICEQELADLANRFYPDLDVHFIPIWQVKLPQFTIACDTKPFFDANFPGQSTQILWLPHGNSDKGFSGPFFETLKEEIALVYGQRMIDFMGEKGVFPKTIRVGNFRREYARLQVEPNGKIFLYAPTWDDAEKSNSFWKAFPHLAKRLPDDTQLWIKLHPNTLKKFAPEIEILMGKYGKKNIQLLPDNPPIYPLLAKCSAYIGDMSSIGYDFLAFERPMFFLNAKSHLPLHNCGSAIDPATFDFSLKNDFAAAQKKLYEYTFEKEPHWKEEIDALSGI